MISRIYAVSLIACCSSWADDQKNRFLEMPDDVETLTFDLNTVQMIQPGRLSIVSTTIAHPDVMKFNLKVLDILRTSCARPDGEYPAPADVFTLGSPDLPVGSIQVKSGQRLLEGKTYQTKFAFWSFPYSRLAVGFAGLIKQRAESFHCKNLFETEDEQYWHQRTLIMNGLRIKKLFDCKRGLSGYFINEGDDPAKVLTSFIKRGSQLEREYVSVCSRVMKERPYLPPE